MSHPQSFLDRSLSRFIALLIALGLLGSLLYIWQDDFFPSPNISSVKSANPDYDKCILNRVGSVEKMKREGIINTSQYNQFKNRAISYCQTQFPPKN